VRHLEEGLQWGVVISTREISTAVVKKGSKGKGAEGKKGPAVITHYRCKFGGGDSDMYTIEQMGPLMAAATAEAVGDRKNEGAATSCSKEALFFFLCNF
jgi:hypothetical protein